MYRGKYQKKRHASVLSWILVCAILLTTSISGVSAYLSMSSLGTTNSLNKATTPEVAVSGTTISVKPNGYAVYLRVAVDVYWKNTSTGSILAKEPTGWSVSEEKWSLIDGFYYYSTSIIESAELPFPLVQGNVEKAGYELSATISAQIV